MSTQVGNTKQVYGREFNVSVSNMGGDNILDSAYLKENTIIINSKIDNDFNDVGSPSLFVTDSNGRALRLTYTIQPGNGLYVDPNDTDVLRMHIDESSIMADDGDELYVSKHNIIDNNTLTVNPDDTSAKRGRISVVTANLEKASDILYGIVKADERTTYIPYEYIPAAEGNDETSDEGKYVTTGMISVNTQNLDTVDDTFENEDGSTGRDGIVRHNSEMFSTIKAVDGKLDVITKNLEHASSEEDGFGIATGDNVTIGAHDGILTVKTEGLDYATTNSYGTVRGDENTINVADGVLKVNTRNLAAATVNDYGVVMLDGWSIDTSPNNGKIEVKRFPEIEALLTTNNPEHEIFRNDIESLKNRVTKLETVALQEIIEFFTHNGDPTTELPEPVFDKKEWKIVNKYADRKTISFSIKSNCKFYLYVDYKKGSNDYGQVTLLNVQYSDDSNLVIPYESLANHIFNATNGVKTLWFTFQVKNYDADNNKASTNTQVIIKAASINDASINQTGFHIFKCWNNRAYEEDIPEYNNDILPTITGGSSYWIIERGNEKLNYYNDNNSESQEESSNDYSIKVNSLTYNTTSSKNFYFHTYVNGFFFDGKTNEITYSDSVFDQSSNIYTDNEESNHTDYDITVVSCYNLNFEENEEGIANTESEAEWVSASITASYNSTKRFNVLNVKSTEKMNVAKRGAEITIALPEYEMPSLNPLSSIFTNETVEEVEDLITFKNELDSLTELIEGENTYLSKENNAVKVNNSNIKPTIYKSSSVIKLSDILQEDIDKFTTNYDALVDTLRKSRGVNTVEESSEETNEEENPNTEIDISQPLSNYEISNKTTYINYHTYLGLAKEYANKIIKEYNSFSEYYTNFEQMQINEEDRTLTFKYIEELKEAAPIVFVNTNIAYAGGAGINVTIKRNDSSYLLDENWGVKIKYNFINKNGDIVDADGNVIDFLPGEIDDIVNNESESESETSSNKYYEFPILYPGTKTSYTTTVTNATISNAADGASEDFITQNTYGSVIAVYCETINNKSIGFGWNDNRNDGGTVYWASNSESNITSIKEDVYVEFELEGQQAEKKSGRKYSFWSFNIKGKPSGYSELIEQSDNITFKGLSSSLSKGAKTASYKTWIKGSSGNYYIRGTSKNENKLVEEANTWKTNNLNKLIIDTATIPVQIANNIIGIRILDVDVTKGAFKVDPTITYSATGSWKTNTGANEDNPSNYNYTFGNAKITNINIEPWDDISMVIRFNIIPGTATLLPEGATIVENKNSNNGVTKFTFLQDSRSYLHSQFYNYYTFESTAWNQNTGCEVKITLHNKYSLSENAIFWARELVYMKDINSLKTVYLDQSIRYALTNTARNAMYQNNPLLTNITGIKFWIGLNTSGITVQKKFESSLSSMGVQVNISGKYISGAMKSISVVNALYGSTTNSSSTGTTTTSSSGSGSGSRRGGGGGGHALAQEYNENPYGYDQDNADILM